MTDAVYLSGLPVGVIPLEDGAYALKVSLVSGVLPDSAAAAPSVPPEKRIFSGIRHIDNLDSAAFYDEGIRTILEIAEIHPIEFARIVGLPGVVEVVIEAIVDARVNAHVRSDHPYLRPGHPDVEDADYDTGPRYDREFWEFERKWWFHNPDTGLWDRVI